MTNYDELLATTWIVKPAYNLAKTLLKPITDQLANNVKGKLHYAYHNFFNSYADYLEKSFVRHSSFNSIVFKNEQKKLEDYYLPLTLIKSPEDTETLISEYPKALIEKTNKVLIVDTAGMGKTTLLKFLFISCIKDSASIPIYIELRKLSKKTPIVSFILDQLTNLGEKHKTDIFFKLLDSKNFTFFLDGYDEIPEKDREAVTSDLHSFIGKASGNNYVMSSRDEGGLTSFSQFQRYTIKPLNNDEAYSLLRKYADDKLATVLITKLDLPENKSIHEFLTNPLLTSLLYKSFEYKQTIPLKKHIFYRQVFEALYEAHDLTKEGGEFQREKRSGVGIDRFERIMRALGILCYRISKVELTADEILEIIDKAKELTSESKVNSSAILHDLTHAVPLLVKDGNYVRWSHKSIQEYFAARFICRDTKDKQEGILLNYSQRNTFSTHQNLLSLCADIDRASFDRAVVKNIAEKLVAEYHSIYIKGFEKIPKESLLQRKELVVGRLLFFIRIIKPTHLMGEAPEYHEELHKQFDEILVEAKAQIKESDSTNYQAVLSDPSILLFDTGFQMATSLKLNFVEPTEVLLGNKESDLIDKSIKCMKINDDPDSTLNDLNNFSTINQLIARRVGWKFNEQKAQEFLYTLERELRAQEELNLW